MCRCRKKAGRDCAERGALFALATLAASALAEAAQGPGVRAGAATALQQWCAAAIIIGLGVVVVIALIRYLHFNRQVALQCCKQAKEKV